MNPVELRAGLDRVAERGAAELRAVRASAASAQEAPRALPLLWLLPLFGLMTSLGFLAFGATPRLLTLPRMLALMCAAPLALVAVRALMAWLQPWDRALVLALVDEQLNLRGRVTSADEFLARADRPLGSFELAALEDASAAVSRAGVAPFALPRAGWNAGEESAPHFIAALLLLFLYCWLGAVVGSAPTPPGAPARPTVAGLEAGAPATDHRAPQQLAPEPEPTEPKAAPKEPRTDAKTEPKPGDKAAKLPDDMRASEGKTGKGKSAEAQSQSSASESRGAPSGQSPAPPKEGTKPNLETKPPKKKESSQDQPRDPKEEGDQGGSTAGRGSAKGSNRNTTTSKWSSKDQVTTPDDQEIEDDEKIEDEDEEQKSRGGMQPSLRDRRPPVSRDLRIGFGNRPNPDANGRGGPSEGKKSRGTASLVLGVPIPDRVKGQPNPGPTRITQERIEPSAEEQAAVQARARLERAAALGQLARPAPPDHPRLLDPWQRDLIRTYIGQRRSPVSGAPTP